MSLRSDCAYWDNLVADDCSLWSRAAAARCAGEGRSVDVFGLIVRVEALLIVECVLWVIFDMWALSFCDVYRYDGS